MVCPLCISRPGGNPETCTFDKISDFLQHIGAKHAEDPMYMEDTNFRGMLEVLIDKVENYKKAEAINYIIEKVNEFQLDF